MAFLLGTNVKKTKPMYKHILLATDGLEPSIKAETYALQLNVSNNIQLTVIHVLDDKLCHYGKVDTLAPLEARESFIDYVIEEQKEASKESLERLKTQANSLGANYELLIQAGEPVDVITSIANDSTIDLVILGGKRSKRARGFKSLCFADKLSSKIEQSIITII